jgi:hypothetical protein
MSDTIFNVGDSVLVNAIILEIVKDEYGNNTYDVDIEGVVTLGTTPEDNIQTVF